MKYIDEFRDKKLIKEMARRINKIAPRRQINIMEVCGTHTQSFCKFGLQEFLPPGLKLIAGPGCPVCVSSQEYIDRAILYSRENTTMVVTFADMLRVPGSASTLEKERAKGASVSVVYSPLDTLKIARSHPQKRIIFLGVGFETTAPTIALSILAAKREGIKNIFFFNSLKLIPPAMEHLLKDGRLNLSGFLCPGHVSAVIGTKPYEFIPKRYKISCCVAGFEPLDILEGLYIILLEITQQAPAVANQYMRVVTRQGNPQAQDAIAEVFTAADASWRGLGKIPSSGLKVREKFSRFDAEREFPIKRRLPRLDPKLRKCRCADILKGLISPLDCPLFSKICAPENPVGPCMVSYEGACNAYYKYRK